MVEAFFDKEPNDAVAVEDEVCAAGFVVADHAGGVVRLWEWGVLELVVSYVRSAISCGVWGRMWTFSCVRGVETVAVGF